MTLEELFVNIKYRYDNTGVERAKSSLGQLKNIIDNVGGALDTVNNKLNLLTGAAVAGATVGTIAYQRWSRSMVELSGKAGLTIRQFKALTRESSSIARYTGLGGSYIREMQQRAFSLGASRRLSQNLAHLGGILHTTRQATGTDAVEAAMALQGSGLGHAARNLQMVHAASQVGGGNVPDYFSAATTLAATAGPAGVGIEDLLAMLTIGSRGGSLSGAAAGIDQFLLAIKREPEKRRGELFKQRTGQDWGNLDKILQAQGMTALIRHIADNFEPGEIFRLFGEKEAIKTVSLLVGAVEDLDKNRRAISTAQEDDSIGGFDRDTYKEFSRRFDRFTTSMGQFWKAYGEPFVQVLSPLLAALTWLLNAVVRLNEFLGGILAWLPAIATGLLVFRKVLLPAFFANMARKFVTGIRNAGAPSFMAGTFADEERKEKKKKGKKGKKGDIEVGPAAILGGIVGLFTGMITKIYRFLRNVGLSVTRFLGMTWHVAKHNAWYRRRGGVGHYSDPAGGKGFMHRLFNWQAKSFFAPTLLVLGGIAASLTKIVFWSSIIGGIFAGYSKLRKWDHPDMDDWRKKDAQADYFRRQGLPGGEPAPGSADIAAANRALAEAERSILWEAFAQRVREMLPDSLKYMFDGLVDVIQFVDNIFIGIGDFFRELVADPRATIGMLWDKVWGKSAEFDSWMMRKFLEATGDSPSEADALDAILQRSSSDTLAQPTIRITREQARALGMEGGEFEGHLGAPNVDSIILPTPPANLTPQSVSNEVVINFGDIRIDTQSTDRFDIAKDIQDAIRDELRNSADYIIQEMDYASP